ncbi:MAG: UDP-3-O-(3-hydroxymyristoyl)glucosamine N-acyltransferase [Gammaproteobacteria bacterium RIFCSPHIGHO2_12_FULL_42_10]|nr:MAG: UDP-3-O-(3-hydroxymyristoyl)glucosamine N-acyltransferase [Gammaproteobacteria bacterium RIFCSPHIGHO2_12_FULL_42_10]
MKENRHYSLKELTHGLDVIVRGDSNCVITGVSSIHEAKAGHLTFLMNALYRKYLPSTQASAVILSEAEAANCPCTAVITCSPYSIYARMAAYFDQKKRPLPGIHPTASIGEHCEIGQDVSIGAHSVIGDHVSIGAGTVIGPACTLGDYVVIGEASCLDAHVTLYHLVVVGQRAHFSSGVVVGSDGFGFANDQGAWHKVPQLGTVVIGDDVAIGANTTIDRGAIGDTKIGDGVKLDNLIQVGHNVSIGAHTVIAGCTGISGSTKIGKHCMIGGATCFAGHLTICDHTIVTGMSSVTKSITEPGMYSSGIVGAVPSHEFRKQNARFYRLGKLMDRVKTLEKKMTQTIASPLPEGESHK